MNGIKQKELVRICKDFKNYLFFNRIHKGDKNAHILYILTLRLWHNSIILQY